MSSQVSQVNVAPSLFKLGACFIYEALTVTALSMLGVWFFLLIFGEASFGIKRYLLQLFLWVFVGLYFVLCWVRSGQTLAMRAWRFRLVGQNNQCLTLQVAIVRYVLASFSLALLGIGFFWAILDDRRCFLHDKLLKTKWADVR